MSSSAFLILAAFPPEIAPFKELLTLDSVELNIVGIGGYQAAAQTSKILASYSPQEIPNVIFNGSVGSADSNIELLSLVVATEAILADAAICSKQGFFPELLETRISANSDLVSLAKKHLSADISFSPVYSTTAISMDSGLSKSLWTTHNTPFENLELFGLAAACQAFGAPWFALSAVTNYTCADGHQQWMKNYLAAAAKTAQYLKSFLSHFSSLPTF